LCRRQNEPVDTGLKQFYSRLLECLKRPEVHDGEWQLHTCRTAWDGNPTAGQFIASSWKGTNGRRLLVAANYAGNQGQCYVELPFAEIAGKQVVLRDLLGSAEYTREGNDLLSRGLYLDLPAWGCHAFEVL
jgi:hypothetical protein